MGIAQKFGTLIMTVAIAASACARSASTNRPASSCQISPTSFDGWQAQQISNQWVRVTIVPQLGGRVMQVTFNGHNFLFVNPKYQGQYTPPAEANGKWINYGGDKIWPLPEGDQDEHHWVLKSDPLDDGEYTFHITAQGKHCAALLEGPPDPTTGLQYSREISVAGDSPAIAFHAVMKNIANHPITWSVQSVTQYDLADQANAGTFNRNFYGFTPVNPHSAYFSGYQVRAGLADDPSFEVKDGLFRLHWLYLENEVWLDSPAGWLAVVDGNSQFAVVEKFNYRPRANYPGNATVIFYKNGVALGLDEHSVPKLTRLSPEETPYYMEAELNSPVVTLKPGESYAFDTQWFPTRANSVFNTVTSAGLVSTPATLTRTSGGLLITGTFGVFFPGEVKAYFLDARGAELGRTSIAAANPAELLSVHAELVAPANTVKIALHLLDAAGVDRGILSEADTKLAQGGTA
jgi:Domain of unknown function (DUF4380)